MVSTTHTCLCRAHRRKELRLGMGVLRFARLMLAVPVRSVIIICRTRDDDLQRHPGADADVQCSRSPRMILDPIYISVLCIVLCFMLYHTYVNVVYGSRTPSTMLFNIFFQFIFNDGITVIKKPFLKLLYPIYNLRTVLIVL
jgi:hypothetical protein